jgi:uncharacterized protein YbaR (Trm112 family)
MFIELVDSLRCVAPHEDTWLVASADRMEGRRLVEGTLGCPTCRAAYAIRDGVVWLGVDAAVQLPVGARPDATRLEAEAMRLAALLDLREPGARALLGGTRGHLAHVVASLTGAELLLLDPPADVHPGEGVSVVRSGGRVPLAASSMRAAALDAALAGAMPGVLHAVRDRGRIVAPGDAPLPDEAAELARDARDWVAERHARPSAPVQLTLMRGGRGR